MTELGEYNINVRGSEAKEIILDPVYLDPSIVAIFDVIGDMIPKSKRELVYAGERAFGGRTSKGCGDSAPLADVKFTPRYIETEEYKDYDEVCKSSFDQTILSELQRRGANRDSYDLTDTELMDIMTMRFRQSNTKQIKMLAFFGDKSASEPERAVVDGMFTKLLPVGISSGAVKNYDALANKVLAEGEAITLLDAVEDNAPNQLAGLDMSQKAFLVDRNVYQRLKKDIRDRTNNSSLVYEILTGGQKVMTFNGIMIVPMLNWNLYAEQYLDLQNPNYVILTALQNLTVATDKDLETPSFQQWYDIDSELNKIRLKMALGFNYKHDKLLSVAMPIGA